MIALAAGMAWVIVGLAVLLAIERSSRPALVAWRWNSFDSIAKLLVVDAACALGWPLLVRQLWKGRR